MKFATAFGLLHFAVASSGVAGASASAAVGPRAGADADAPEPQQLRHRALQEDDSANGESHDQSILTKPNISFVKPVSETENVEIFVFDGCTDIEDALPCHQQVITEKDAISGTEHLFVNTHNWCTDSPFLKINVRGVSEYKFELPGHRPKSGTCGDPSEDCFVNMGTLAACFVYRTISTMDDGVADYAGCLDENGHTFGGFCKCDHLLQTIQATRNIVRTLAANLEYWLQTATGPSFQKRCQSGEPRLQHIEFCNAHADAEAWLNNKKESLCIG